MGLYHSIVYSYQMILRFPFFKLYEVIILLYICLIRYEYCHTCYSELLYLSDYIQSHSTWTTRHGGVLFARPDMYLSYLLG